MFPTMGKNRVMWNGALDSFQREVDRLYGRLAASEATGDLVGSYPVNIWEDDNQLHVEAELPGFTREQIEVTLENGVLSVSAQRPASASKGVEHLNERRYNRVARCFSLPNTFDENKVDAHLENGVLSLTLHKRDEVKPRKIEVH